MKFLSIFSTLAAAVLVATACSRDSSPSQSAPSPSLDKEKLVGSWKRVGIQVNGTEYGIEKAENKDYMGRKVAPSEVEVSFTEAKFRLMSIDQRGMSGDTTYDYTLDGMTLKIENPSDKSKINTFFRVVSVDAHRLVMVSAPKDMADRKDLWADVFEHVDEKNLRVNGTLPVIEETVSVNYHGELDGKEVKQTYENSTVFRSKSPEKKLSCWYSESSKHLDVNFDEKSGEDSVNQLIIRLDKISFDKTKSEETLQLPFEAITSAISNFTFVHGAGFHINPMQDSKCEVVVQRKELSLQVHASCTKLKMMTSLSAKKFKVNEDESGVLDANVSCELPFLF